MKQSQNIQEVLNSGLDYMGFIHYPKSKRFVGESFVVPELIQSNAKVKSVAVMVNQPLEDLLVGEKFKQYDLLQLHGDESPEYCYKLKGAGYKIIKAFGINSSFDFEVLNEYESVIDYFLFDTKSDQYGGTGMQFSWSVLENYRLDKPYFLSGGISPDNITQIEQIKVQPYCIDINSKFEIEPGLKDSKLVSEAIDQIKTL